MTNFSPAQLAEPVTKTDRDLPVVSCFGNAFVIRVRLVNGHVDNAWSTGRMMRNMNVLLRDELDAQGRPQFINQPCCLCNDGHALAAIKAVENLVGVTPTHSAALVRKLVQSLRCIQEHLLHFYQFHLSDWVNLNAALRADPVSTASLGRLPGETPDHFRTVQKRLGIQAGMLPEAIAESGYRGPDELHLLLHGHALQSVKVSASIQAALGLLKCGPKGFQAYTFGGLPKNLDLGKDTRERLRTALEECREFISKTFLTDLAHLAEVYDSWAEKGKGSSFLSGDNSGRLLLAEDSNTFWQRSPSDGKAIREELEPIWNSDDRRCYRLSPHQNEPSFKWEQADCYWLSAPRHGDTACEVGPLARVLSGWLSGHEPIRRALSAMLDDCKTPLSAMNSTLGRVLSRGVESAGLMESLFGLLDELEAALAVENQQETTFRMPTTGIGIGRVEVPRGLLTHEVTWDRGRIVSHDYLIPSMWNFSPRDTFGSLGPLERALLGTPVADAQHPVEILRTLHQLDPCNACHVVVEDRDTGRTILTTA